MSRTPVDQRALDRVQEVLASWNNNPFHSTTQQLISQALANPETTPYFEAIYRLLLLTKIRIDSPEDLVPEESTSKAIECLKVIRIPGPSETSAVERTAILMLLICGFGIATAVGGRDILETWDVGPGIVGVVWERMSLGMTKLDFASKLLAQHDSLVQAESNLWKANLQPTKAQTEYRKQSLRVQQENAKTKMAAEQNNKWEEEEEQEHGSKTDGNVRIIDRAASKTRRKVGSACKNSTCSKRYSRAAPMCPLARLLGRT